VRRLLVLVPLVGALQLAAAATAADPTAWKLHNWFVAAHSELRLQTSMPSTDKDCNWQNASGFYSPTSATPDFPEYNCAAHFLWSKTCQAGPQTVTFTKKLYLPGAPRELQASLVSYGDRPLNMRIEVNDKPALTAQHSVHKRDLRSAARLFKLGMNTVTVEAAKPATGKTACNSSKPEYGVYAQIRGVFANDMVVTAPTGHATTSGVFQGAFTVRNNGPSAASIASVAFGAYTSKLKPLTPADRNRAIVVQGPGIDSDECTYSYSAQYYKAVSYTGFSVSCPIAGGLKPGQSVPVTVTYQYQLPAGPFYEEWPITWGAAGDLVDPNSKNSQGARLQNACRNDPAYPNPKCTQSMP
jgi:hypothetical protein